MKYSTTLYGLGLGLLVLLHCGLAQIEQVTKGQRPVVQQQHPLRTREECRLENLNVLKPARRIEAEAGYTELWDEDEDEFICAGAAVVRHVIRQRGLFLPAFTNAPELLYVVRGQGIHGMAIPGCPETFEEDESSQYRRAGRREFERESFRGDKHQKVRLLREGDVLALPAGVTHWIYNNGRSELELVSVLYTSQEANQLDERIRKFFLAGNPQQRQQQGGSSRWSYRRQRPTGTGGGGQQQEESFGNLFNGFDDELLAESFDVDRNLVQRLKCQDDNRGHIVEVRNDLEITAPPEFERERGEEGESEWERERERREGRRGGRSERQREYERERERREREQERRRGGRSEYERERERRRRRGCRDIDNGLEETFCSMRFKENINDPARADFYNPRGGRITTLNSFSLPILRFLQLSAEKGVLYQNAITPPHYYMNSHAIIFVVRGSARIQIVGDSGQTAFDGQVQQGQLFVVPQNFAVLKRASSEGFEWIAFRTSDNALVSPLAGRVSVFRALPEEVLMNAYQFSRQDARRLKYGREEVAVFSPGSRSQFQGRERDD